MPLKAIYTDMVTFDDVHQAGLRPLDRRLMTSDLPPSSFSLQQMPGILELSLFKKPQQAI